MKESYYYMRGRTKPEVIEQMGQGLNLFDSHLWTYNITGNWFYKDSILYIYFDGEIVIHTFFRKSFKLF